MKTDRGKGSCTSASQTSIFSKTLSVTDQWQPTNVELEVPDRTDRLSIRLSSGRDAVFLASPSFRRVANYMTKSR